MSGPERRAAPRAMRQIPLTLSHDSKEIKTQTHNMSTSGAYCTISRFIPLMTKMNIRFEIPGESHHAWIHCVGVVVRIDPPQEVAGRRAYDVAIFFSDVPERDRHRLAQYVQHDLPASPPAGSR